LTKGRGCAIFKGKDRFKLGGAVKELRSRHMAIMDALVAYPAKTQKEIAELLGYSETGMSDIVNQPLFKMAFEKYRERYEKNLQQTIADVTVAALKVSQKIIEDEGESTVNKQASIRDILSLGHAKAIDRRATLSIEGEIPKEAFAALTGLMKELEQPFSPTRLLTKKDGDVVDAEIFEVEQVIATQ
jgi:DNA-binding MarR family transcriptional regulator